MGDNKRAESHTGNGYHSSLAGNIMGKVDLSQQISDPMLDSLKESRDFDAPNKSNKKNR